MIRFLFILTFVFFETIAPASASALNQILNVRHWVAPDHTRVVIDTSDDASYTVEKMDRKIVINLDDSAVPSHMPSLIHLNEKGVDTAAIRPHGHRGVSIELTTPDPVQATVFKLKKFQDKPFRIVIDIVLPDIVKQQSEAREQIKITRKNRIVVIDPGHGGEAVGAVGRKGTFEKDVALSIGKKLRDILNGKPGYNAFLTRDGDYYVSFKKRLMIAKEYGADIFLSIHADAAKNRTATGSSVYCFSAGGASNEAAKILARNENLADVVGGVPSMEGSDASDPIILDMFQTHSINQSRTLGVALLRHLAAANHLKSATVQEAQFLVLKLPDVPSVLIETAYISNPNEEKLLRTAGFQTRIAESVALSVIEYLPPLPLMAVAVSSRGTVLEGERAEPVIDVIGAAKKASARMPGPEAAVTGKLPVKVDAAPTVKENIVRYQVKRGDTLHSIARNYGTTVGALLALNRMSPHDPLVVNRMLAITGKPSVAADKGKAGLGKAIAGKKSGRVVYRVKKGDTLTAIARMHGTTVRTLVDLNHLKPNEPLVVNRKMVIGE